MNIILLGAPGSGKGTQAEKLVTNQGFVQLSTGDLMRKEMQENTALGRECKKYIDQGNLVPDELVNQMVENYLVNTRSDNLIFDGYPRTLDQATAIDEMLKKLGKEIDKVFYIQVSDEVIIDRISNRLVCPTCKRSYNLVSRPPKTPGICDYDGTKLVHRSDDEPQKVMIRLREYEKNTKPLVDYYHDIEKVIKIPGHDSDANIAYQQILEGLK